jgi:HK97 family phage major capsid protein
MTANEHIERRAKAIANAKVIIDGASERELTADEQAQVDAMFAEADAAGAAADDAARKEKLSSYEAELRESQGRKVQPGKPGNRTIDGPTEKEAREMFRAWACAGTDLVLPGMQQRAASYGFNVNARSIEIRALSKATSNAPVPADFTREYEKKLKYYFPISEAVTSFSTADGRDLPLYQADDTSNAAAIVGEGSSIGSSTDPSFAVATYKAWKYASPIVIVSLEMLQDNVFDLPTYLGDAFADRFGRAYDAAVVSTNAGSAAPAGLLLNLTVAGNLGSGNVITLADLIDLETDVDIAYRLQPGCGWLMNDKTWGAIRQLSDDNAFPIFLGDLQNGVSPRLLGYPVFISNNMTSIASPGDNQPLIAFGDFSKYRWRTVQGGRTLTRLDELYAATGQVGFVMLERADGRFCGHSGCVKTLNSFDAS